MLSKPSSGRCGKTLGRAAQTKKDLWYMNGNILNFRWFMANVNLTGAFVYKNMITA